MSAVGAVPTSQKDSAPVGALTAAPSDLPVVRKARSGLLASMDFEALSGDSLYAR